jgi:translation initiation factor 2 subunit 2
LKYPKSKNPPMTRSYEELLSRARAGLDKDAKKSGALRLELPEPDVIWVGNKTIFRNYAEFPKLLRRESGRVLMYLAKELATAASLDGERAIFIGRKDRDSFSQLLQRYVKDGVICPVCGSPDTHLEKDKRMWFMVCEACGARSVAKVA